jgi:hypothetical protein
MAINPRPDDNLFRLTRLLREQSEQQIAARHDAWGVVGKRVDAFDAEAITLRAKHDALMDEAAEAIATLTTFERDTLAPKVKGWSSGTAN